MAHGMGASVIRTREAWRQPKALQTVVVVGTMHDEQVSPLSPLMRLLEVSGNAVLLEVRNLAVTAAPAAWQPRTSGWVPEEGLWVASGAYIVADDSRLCQVLMDLTGLSYAPAIPLHSRREA